jgi:hypothetical protein
VKEARTARKDWRVYEMNLTGWPSDPGNDKPGADKNVPKPDLRISNGFAPDRAALFSSGIMFPVGGATMGEMPDAMKQLVPDELRQAMEKTSPIVYYGAMLSEIPASVARFPMTLYDFRSAPQSISDALKWVKPRDTPTPTARTSVRARL